MTPALTVVRNTPDWVAFYDDDRAARLYGPEYRVQRLYFWTEIEAIDFGWDHELDGGPVRIEAA